MMETQKEICKQALAKWGEDAQLIIAMEECAELIQQLSKYIRYKNDAEHSTYDLAQECADVYVMLHQIMEMLDSQGIWNMKNIIDSKFYTLRKRIEATTNDEQGE